MEEQKENAKAGGREVGGGEGGREGSGREGRREGEDRRREGRRGEGRRRRGRREKEGRKNKEALEPRMLQFYQFLASIIQQPFSELLRGLCSVRPSLWNFCLQSGSGSSCFLRAWIWLCPVVSIPHVMRDPDNVMPVCDEASQLRMGFPVGAVWWPLGELNASAQSPWKDLREAKTTGTILCTLVSLLRGLARSQVSGTCSSRAVRHFKAAMVVLEGIRLCHRFW